MQLRCVLGTNMITSLFISGYKPFEIIIIYLDKVCQPSIHLFTFLNGRPGSHKKWMCHKPKQNKTKDFEKIKALSFSK